MEVVVNKIKSKYWSQTYYDLYLDSENRIEVIPSEFEEVSSSKRLVFPCETYVRIDRSQYPPEVYANEAADRMFCDAMGVFGTTYPIKDIIQSYGYRWDNIEKNWYRKRI